MNSEQEEYVLEEQREITKAALHPLLVVVIISIRILLANCWAGRLAHKLKILQYFAPLFRDLQLEKNKVVI